MSPPLLGRHKQFDRIRNLIVALEQGSKIIGLMDLRATMVAVGLRGGDDDVVC